MIFLFRCIILYQISSTKGKNNKVKKKQARKNLEKIEMITMMKDNFETF
jgi:hypothetical protein